MSVSKLNQELINHIQNSVFKANQSINLASNSNPLCNGFVVKKFYQTKILKHSPFLITNKNLQNNQFRAYYSSSFLPIFEQIYYQLGFDNKKITVFLHPFTPIDIIDFLLSFGHNLVFFKLNKNTLGYETNNKNLIKADLVIHYTFNQLLDEINNNFISDQKIITIDSSNTINNQYYNYINKLNNSGYIQIIDTNPLPDIFNQIFGTDLASNQLCIGVVAIPLVEILNRDYYKTNHFTQQETDKNDKTGHDQLQFLQLFTYLLGGTVENKKIIDRIKDKIFTKHITIDLQENIQPREAKKIFEETFYKLQNQVYPDYWLEILEILTEYSDSQSWLNLDFTLIQEKKEQSIEKIINLTKQFDNEVDITLPANINYKDLSLLHLYASETDFCYAKFAQEGINFWSLPVLHPQVMISINRELRDIINYCLICKL